MIITIKRFQLLVLILLHLTFVALCQQVWTLQKQLPTSFFLYNATYANNIFVAVGDSGTILTSTDGSTWAQQSSGTKEELDDVAWGNNKFVIVGGFGTVLISQNGINWIKSSLDSLQWNLNVIWANDRFVAVGYGGENGNSSPVFTSSDGIIWMPHSSSQLPGFLSGISYGNNLFIAFNETSGMFTSNDLINWTADYSRFLNNKMQAITYGSNKFIAVVRSILANGRPSDTLYSSSDGTNWVILNLPSSSNLFIKMMWFNDHFVGLGYTLNSMGFAYPDSFSFYSSADGIVWSITKVSGFPTGLRTGFFGFAFNGETYVALTDSIVATATAYNNSVISNKPEKPIQNLNISDKFISYFIPYQSDVSARVLDLQGRITATIINRFQYPGNYIVTIPDIPNGLYILSFKSKVSNIYKSLIIHK